MGKWCKHENWKLCEKPAIRGLHSEWVEGVIVGSQRLSDRLIKEFNIIDQFKKEGIVAVFNLQEPGEHPYCGDGIINKTGFSYTPELLMNNQIQYYNFYWKDLTTPSHQITIKICQIMHHIVINGGPERKNKMLVHCHAGQGRTAIITGAYLVYSNLAKDAEDAIIKCRKGRPKMFHKKYNCEYLRSFEKYLKNARMLYPTQNQSLSSIIQKQRIILQGKDADRHKHLPKVLTECIKRLKALINENETINLLDSPEADGLQEDNVIMKDTQDKEDNKDLSPVREFPSEAQMDNTFTLKLNDIKSTGQAIRQSEKLRSPKVLSPKQQTISGIGFGLESFRSGDGAG